MQTVTIDIINMNAMQLLHDLELLKLIKVRRNSEDNNNEKTKWDNSFKGAMSKQPIDLINEQLKEIRSEWE
jgi:hypothetical protein